jgi:hypothetical protein
LTFGNLESSGTKEIVPRKSWTQTNIGAPINKVSFSVGGPSPFITKLNFYTKLGSIYNYSTEEYQCQGFNSDFEVYHETIDF